MYNLIRQKFDNLAGLGSVMGLESIKRLLESLGNPQNKLKVIHVAGTNGKGSVLAFLSSVLVRAGYRVGKYTSPAVFEYLEKYSINDRYISENKFGTLGEEVLKAAGEIASNGLNHPTLFEIETALAFLYFEREKCDIVLLETGMGGDEDATNVCDSVIAAIITSVSLDHVGILGDTLSQIAYHKAGIIKEKCPVILYGRCHEDVISVVKKCAEDKQALLIMAREAVVSRKENRYIYSYTTFFGDMFENIESGLKGIWQTDNGCVALEAISLLRRSGFTITDENVSEGFLKAYWPGRFETISDEPLIIIDGAHNPGAATELKKTLDTKYKDTDITMIIGVLRDKDYNQVVSGLVKNVSCIITVTPDNPRALSARELAGTVELYNKNVIAADSLEDAYRAALDNYGKKEGKRAIIACGSLSYLGDFKRLTESHLILAGELDDYRK